MNGRFGWRLSDGSVRVEHEWRPEARFVLIGVRWVGQIAPQRPFVRLASDGSGSGTRPGERAQAASEPTRLTPSRTAMRSSAAATYEAAMTPNAIGKSQASTTEPMMNAQNAPMPKANVK